MIKITKDGVSSSTIKKVPNISIICPFITIERKQNRETNAIKAKPTKGPQLKIKTNNNKNLSLTSVFHEKVHGNLRKIKTMSKSQIPLNVIPALLSVSG